MITLKAAKAIELEYHVSSYKHKASNVYCFLIRAAHFQTPIKISAAFSYVLYFKIL